MRRPRPKFKVSFYLYFCRFWINVTQINFENIKRNIQRIISDSCFQLKSWFNVDARAPSIPLLNFPFISGLVHKGTNHFPKAISECDPLCDWDRDLNYVCSHALQTPYQSRTWSAHCEVIFCSHCTLHADWPMHAFSAHFQNAHAQISFRKSFAFACPQNQALYANHDPKRLNVS